VFWWQLIARGYGLAYPGADGRPVRRPAFAALATLVRELEGSTFVGPLPAEPPARLYHFRRADGSELAVGWSAAPQAAHAALPRPAREIITRDGTPAPPPTGTAVTLVPSPRYFLLAEE